MEPRKKPIRAPLPRAQEVRPLAPATVRRALPTVAMLLAATSVLACSGQDEVAIGADPHVMRATLVVAKPAVTPEPGMGALEKPDPAVPPIGSIAPLPLPPTPAGGPAPIVPTPKVPRTAGVRPPIRHPTI